MFNRLEVKQVRNNIKSGGLGHREIDEVAIATKFKVEMQGKYYHGDTPGHVALSLSGFLSRYLYAGCPWAKRMVNAGDLTTWVDAMKQVVPLETLFSKE